MNKPDLVLNNLWTIMNSSYYYEYRENIHLSVKLTPASHFGSQTDVQHTFTYVVFILSFNILVSCNPEFVSFFWTIYWSTTITNNNWYAIKPNKTKLPFTAGTFHNLKNCFSYMMQMSQNNCYDRLLRINK